MSSPGEFERIVEAIVERFCRQNAQEPPGAEVRRVATQLAGVVAARGLPRPLAAGERGAPGGLPEGERAALAARVLEGIEHPLVAEAARHLVKACFYPEFRDCRDSFREVARDGTCRRQELARVRGRISGTHCVDCPHWTALGPDEHAAMLAREWRTDPAEFGRHRTVFLPEDFRALRRWRHAAVRQRA